ncbi:unnamed protein product [Toxocara canis]|uniref:CCR4-NOT transcription complex subunit 9 n=1 Tax=Toxocara canis TaxID=6265 RepID=A0A183UTV7_TOXCA|nr:unnamed protein product [Toxocara canis]
MESGSTGGVVDDLFDIDCMGGCTRDGSELILAGRSAQSIRDSLNVREKERMTYRFEEEIVNFLLTTEIIPLCLRFMESGCELSKTVAIFILQKILLDDSGLAYICRTYERFAHVAMILVMPLRLWCLPFIVEIGVPLGAIIDF